MNLGVYLDHLRAIATGRSYTSTIGPYEAEFRTKTGREYHHARRATGEAEILKDFLDQLTPNDNVLDIGANVGVFAAHAVDVATDGSVTAFEPHTSTLEALRHNLTLNDTNGAASALGIALANTDGRLRFDIQNEMSGFPSNRISETGKFSVPTARAATLIEAGRIPTPDVMKIDVEGAELDVLRGFDDYLQEVRVAFVEVHPTAGVDEDEVRSILEDVGLQIRTRRLAENELTPFLYAVR